MSPAEPHPFPLSPDNDSTADAFRTPPHNYEAEQALLGAILVNNKAFEAVADFLLPEHFADPVHGRLYESCAKLIEKGHLVTPVTLKTYLDTDPLVQEAGGAEYLAALAGAAATVINAKDFGRIVYDLFLRRELIAVGEDMVNGAFDSDYETPATSQIEGAEQKLFDLASTGNAEGGFQDFKTAVLQAIDMAEAAHQKDGSLSGVPSGLSDLDLKMSGLHKSDLLILAGRPGMGKTALATNVAFNAAQYFTTTDREEDAGKSVAFFSLEMSAEQLATRILSEQARVSSHDIRSGRLTNDDFAELMRASQELHSMPLYIDDTPALTVSAMRTRCRRLARKGNHPSGNNLGLVVVDYLQLMSGGMGAKFDNRVQEISMITRGLKALAKEMDVPVLALSQLSRQVEQREDKRPQLADLRESGSIEQDADVVLFVYREEYYLERRMPQAEQFQGEDKFQEQMEKWQDDMTRVHNLAEVIIGKQRHGPTGKVDLFFDPNYTLFKDLIRDGYAPQEFD